MNIDQDTGWPEWLLWTALVPAFCIFGVIYAVCWVLGIEDRDDLDRGPYQ